MFRRRKQQEQTGDAREAERRALFEELARRPDTVCPFLGLANQRAGYQPEPTGDHRCYAFGDPAPLSDEQQRHVCLERGYSNCPRYLRGVLVIPTEELEALRRPQPSLGPPPPPPPPTAVARPSGGRGRWFVVVPLLVILLVAAGGGWYLLNNPGAAIVTSPTPTASAQGSGSSGPSGTPTPTALPTATPYITPTPLPTPTQGDTFLYYEVTVGPNQPYTVYRVDDAGNVISSLATSFGTFSHAQVQLIDAPNGLRHWRTVNGDLAGYSYIAGRSGPFAIRKVYRSPDGSLSATILPQDQL